MAPTTAPSCCCPPIALVLLALVLAVAATACDGVPPFGMGRSANWYRVHADGTAVEVVGGRADPRPAGGVRPAGRWRVGAAQGAGGGGGRIVRFIDGRTRSCDCEDGTCGNNYVWIEHANGEWSKYTHLATGSVTGKAGLAGDEVAAGTFLGTSRTSGACGVHPHFEVAVPDEPGRPRADPSTGWLEGERVVPRFCGVGGGGRGGDGRRRGGWRRGVAGRGMRGGGGVSVNVGGVSAYMKAMSGGQCGAGRHGGRTS
ncbi:MAG: M23 family metallopeptidase [Anaerolineae bacterium]